MKKILKISLITIICLGTAFFVSAKMIHNFFDDSLPKEKIFDIVTKKQEKIIGYIEEADFDKKIKIRGIKWVNDSREDGYINFYCGGSGMGGQSRYVGFYYLENDNIDVLINSYKNDLYSFDQVGNSYTFKEKDGDNSFYVEKITDCFYYYCQEF